MGLGALQPGHLIVILVIVLLIFGPGKLPELGKAMGDGLRELKKATGGEDWCADRATWALVEGFGCDVVQGYLVSYPQPAADLEAWLDAFDLRVNKAAWPRLEPAVRLRLMSL